MCPKRNSARARRERPHTRRQPSEPAESALRLSRIKDWMQSHSLVASAPCRWSGPGSQRGRGLGAPRGVALSSMSRESAARKAREHCPAASQTFSTGMPGVTSTHSEDPYSGEREPTHGRRLPSWGAVWEGPGWGEAWQTGTPRTGAAGWRWNPWEPTVLRVRSMSGEGPSGRSLARRQPFHSAACSTSAQPHALSSPQQLHAAASQGWRGWPSHCGISRWGGCSHPLSRWRRRSSALTLSKAESKTSSDLAHSRCEYLMCTRNSKEPECEWHAAAPAASMTTGPSKSKQTCVSTTMARCSAKHSE